MRSDSTHSQQTWLPHWHLLMWAMRVCIHLQTATHQPHREQQSFTQTYLRTSTTTTFHRDTYQRHGLCFLHQLQCHTNKWVVYLMTRGKELFHTQSVTDWTYCRALWLPMTGLLPRMTKWWGTGIDSTSTQSVVEHANVLFLFLLLHKFLSESVIESHIQGVRIHPARQLPPITRQGEGKTDEEGGDEESPRSSSEAAQTAQTAEPTTQVIDGSRSASYWLISRSQHCFPLQNQISQEPTCQPGELADAIEKKKKALTICVFMALVSNIVMYAVISQQYHLGKYAMLQSSFLIRTLYQWESLSA